MKKSIAPFLEGVRKEILRHPLVYSILFLLLFFDLVVRVYKVDQVLGFWYDQGRDALVIWDLIHKGKFFLIGPTTGIEGIFRGSWYYWLITPFYFLGKGDPIWPMVFLSVTSVIAILTLYFLGKEIIDRKTGLIAVFIASFSSSILLASRWLSNPTPMLLISVLLLWFIFRYLDKKVWSLPVISFLVGMAIQFGSAAEIFYIPALLIFLFWQRKILPDKKILILSGVVFIATFFPQIIFDLKHEGVLTSALKKFLFEEESFKLSFWNIFSSRLAFYYNVVASKLWVEKKILTLPFLAVFTLHFFANKNMFLQNRKIKITLLFLVIPFLGMFLFQGNKGNVYDYYFTGYYLLIILFFSILVRDIARKNLGKAFAAIFFSVFIVLNLISIKKYFILDAFETKRIVYSDQLKAINWIYKDAKGSSFNVDVYVPPVIPYAYDYLFLWYGDKNCGENLCGLVKDSREKLLYTISEYDFEYPTRIDPWLERQSKIGKIESEAEFGAITVERRIRIE